MIHRALFGSIERFFGVLVEHYAGAFPTWLSPVQVRILPVAASHEDYASEVVAELMRRGVRADMVGAHDPLGKSIRSSKMDKVPYVLVVGDDDVAHRTVGVNAREAEVERDVPLETFAARIDAELGSTRI
ncbi:MAG: His/Gly/Thr/Pro-type tRNA ligase C-terminal domain-containing protein [Actinomycetota bacterium]